MTGRLARVGGLAREVVLSLVSTPLASLLAAMGTSLGIAALVATVGLTQTSNAQIDARFDAQAARTVRVSDAVADRSAAPRGATTVAFPPDFASRLAALAGVRRSILEFAVADASVPIAVVGRPATAGASLGVFGVAGDLVATPSAVTAGRSITPLEQRSGAPVAMLSSIAAVRLGIDGAALPVAVLIDGRPFDAIGIVADFAGPADLDLGVVIPSSVAVADFGVPEGVRAAQVLVTVDLGAAEQVASQVALALRPDDESAVSVVPPVTPHRLAGQVLGDLIPALRLLGALALVVGTVTIANAGVVAVLQRRSELGLRRALGASARDIGAQIVAESALIGLSGALLGSVLGMLLVLVFAVQRQWTPVIDVRVLSVGVAIGVLIGGLAGLVPARMASRVDPVDCLKGT